MKPGMRPYYAPLPPSPHHTPNLEIKPNHSHRFPVSPRLRLPHLGCRLQVGRSSAVRAEGFPLRQYSGSRVKQEDKRPFRPLPCGVQQAADGKAVSLSREEKCRSLIGLDLALEARKEQGGPLENGVVTTPFAKASWPFHSQSAR